MSQSTLERDALEAFDKANPDLIDCNLDDLNDDFEYLFPTPLLLVHSVGWGETNDLPAIIHKGQHRRDLPSDNMSIPDDPLAEIAMQDIVNADSARATQTSFNTSFNIESMANFYAIGSSSFLTCYHSEEREDLTIEDNTSQPPNDLAPGRKWEIIRHVRSKKPYWILDDVVTIICWMIKEKVDIMPKPWQVNAIIDTVYKKKDVVISAVTGSDKSLPYQLIPLIKEGAIVLVVLPTIVCMTDQVCLPVITFYCKL